MSKGLIWTYMQLGNDKTGSTATFMHGSDVDRTAWLWPGLYARTRVPTMPGPEQVNNSDRIYFPSKKKKKKL